MEYLAIIGVPALAAWAVSVAYRCVSEDAIRVLRLIMAAMVAGLVAGIAIGGNVATVVFVIDPLLIAVIEAMLARNVIPSFNRWRLIFKYLPLDLRILAEGPKEIYRSDIARKLDSATLTAIADRKPPESSREVISFRLDAPDSEIIKIYQLQAGVAVLAEPSEELCKLQRRLELQRDEHLRQITLLERTHEAQSILYRQKRERELGERVENDLAEAAARIKQILDDLEAHADSLTNRERLEQLNLVKVLTGYCKRKGMLALASTDSETTTREEIQIISREVMADLRSIGIECAILTELKDETPIAAFNLAYDTLYESVVSVLPYTQPVVMAFLRQNDDNSLEGRISIECAIGLDNETAVERIPQLASSTEPLTATLTEIMDALDTRLAKRRLAYTVGLTDDLVSIVVRIGGARI